MKFTKRPVKTRRMREILAMASLYVTVMVRHILIINVFFNNLSCMHQSDTIRIPPGVSCTVLCAAALDFLGGLIISGRVLWTRILMLLFLHWDSCKK